MDAPKPFVHQPTISQIYEVAGGALKLAAAGVGTAGIGMVLVLICYLGLALKIPFSVAHSSEFFAELHVAEYGAVLPILGPIISPLAVWLANVGALVGSFFLAGKIYEGGEALEKRARAIAEKAGFVYNPPPPA